jgi:hypothetical protein
VFDTRGAQLEVVWGKGKPIDDRVCIHIYADDDTSPVVQAFAIPLSRVRIVTKAEFGSPYCIGNWSLEELINERR